MEANGTDDSEDGEGEEEEEEDDGKGTVTATKENEQAQSEVGGKDDASSSLHINWRYRDDGTEHNL